MDHNKIYVYKYVSFIFNLKGDSADDADYRTLKTYEYKKIGIYKYLKFTEMFYLFLELLESVS